MDSPRQLFYFQTNCQSRVSSAEGCVSVGQCWPAESCDIHRLSVVNGGDDGGAIHVAEVVLSSVPPFFLLQTLRLLLLEWTGRKEEFRQRQRVQ